jgi:hypothetical protein
LEFFKTDSGGRFLMQNHPANVLGKRGKRSGEALKKKNFTVFFPLFLP